MKVFLLLCLLAFTPLVGETDCELPSLPLDPGAPELVDAIGTAKAALALRMQESGAPALSVAIVYDQTVLFSRGYGFAEQGKEATADTLYRIGSITKSFTTTMMMQLFERGKVQPDAPITQYLSSYSVKSCGIDPGPPSLAQLASHLSGLPQSPQIDIWTDGASVTEIDILKSLPDTHAVLPKALRAYSSDLAYVVLGAALGLAADRPYTQYVEEEIFKPLGMNQSAFEVHPGLQGQLAQGYHDGKPISMASAPGMAAAIGIVSSAADLAKFISFQFAMESPVLSMPLRRHLRRPHFIFPGWNRAAGMGWMQSPLRRWTLVGHRGVVPGYSCELLMIPELKLGIAVLTNQDRSLSWLEEPLEQRSAAAHVLEIVAPVVDGLLDLPSPAEKPIADIESYVGTYEPSKVAVLFDPIVIERDGKRLYLRTGPDAFRLTHLEGDTFSMGNLERLTFVRDQTGQITGLVLASGRVKFNRQLANEKTP